MTILPYSDKIMLEEDDGSSGSTNIQASLESNETFVNN